ncbi:phosphoserine phosphatase [Diplocarpon mali]|nr:phosphoserine phosphatase [Diplocarpon mali]
MVAPSTNAALPALGSSRFIFFTDFDGTITQQDSNDFMIEKFGVGPAERRLVFDDILFGRRTFRDGFKELLDGVELPFDECVAALLQSITLDEGFREFHAWAKTHGIPVVVLSGGMEPIIRALLAHLLGDEEAASLPIMSNDVAPRPGKSINDAGGWEITYRDDSSFGHDKSLHIKPYAALPENERPTMFYAGDGVSDFSAAKGTDLLFAREGCDLVTYLERENVPFKKFRDFSEILAVLKDIVSGKTSVHDVATSKA